MKDCQAALQQHHYTGARAVHGSVCSLFRHMTDSHKPKMPTRWQKQLCVLFTDFFFLQRISFAAALSAALFKPPPSLPPCQANTAAEEVGDTRNRKISGGWLERLASVPWPTTSFFFRPLGICSANVGMSACTALTCTANEKIRSVDTREECWEGLTDATTIGAVPLCRICEGARAYKMAGCYARN